MDLLKNLANMLATFITIETGLTSNIQTIQDWEVRKKLKRLSAGIDYSKVAVDVVSYAQEADEYVAMKNMQLDVVISEFEREKFIKDYYASHPNHYIYNSEIDQILNSYLDSLETILSGALSTGEKFLSKKVGEVTDIVQGMRELVEETRNGVIELKDSIIEKEKEDADPQETITCVSPQMIERCKTLDIEGCRFEYYIVGTSANSVFKAIINGVIVDNKDYESICSQIFETAKSIPALFIAADGGTGKSTIMCKLALKAAEDGFMTYFVDAEESICDVEEIDKESFFFIDNAADSQKLIIFIYKHFVDNRYVHIVLADRTYRINILFEDLEIPNWIINGKAIALKYDSNEPIIGKIRPRNIQKIMLSEDLIRRMSDAAIDATIDYYDLDKEVSKRVRSELSYENRSVADIVFDFRVSYQIETKEKVYLKKFEWDWDVWDSIPDLKGTFRYLAALSCYDVSVSCNQIEKISGRTLEIGKIIEEGKLTVVRITKNKCIKLRHDTVADNYFRIQNIRPSDVVREMFENRMMTEKTILNFERKAFSLSNIFQADDEVRRLHIAELVLEFNRIEEFRSILSRHQRIHSLELAVMGVKRSYTGIGNSYLSIKPLYSNQQLLWIKYFIYSVDKTDYIPEELLYSLKEDAGLYKKITKTINDYIRNSYRNLEKERKEEWISYMEQLFSWIIQNINKGDIPGRILLLWVYQRSGRIEKAKDMVYELGQHLTTDKTYVLSLATIQTLETEVKQFVKNNRNDVRIHKINDSIRNDYRALLEYTYNTPLEYISVVRSFVRFQKDTGHYSEAYELARNTADKLIGTIPLYKIYIELGMICQFKNRRNTHFSLCEAIEWFEKATEEIDKSSKELLYTLKPLCKSYLFYEKYEECLELCKQIKTLDSKDKEVMNLEYEAIRLKRVRDMGMPIGKRFNWEETPEDDKIRTEITRLIETMTEEQLSFFNLFGGLSINKSFYTYRVAYSIKNNIYIPRKILFKLRVGDTRIIDKLYSVNLLSDE